jgi:hypothetical protein
MYSFEATIARSDHRDNHIHRGWDDHCDRGDGVHHCRGRDDCALNAVLHGDDLFHADANRGGDDDHVPH